MQSIQHCISGDVPMFAAYKEKIPFTKSAPIDEVETKQQKKQKAGQKKPPKQQQQGQGEVVKDAAQAVEKMDIKE